MKKIWKNLTSFKLAIVLFIIIATYSIIGTVLPQGAAADFYLDNYSSLGKLIVLLQFNQVYSSLIFRIILLFFLINLIGCSLNLLPSQMRRIKKNYFLLPGPKSENLWGQKVDLLGFRKVLEKKNYLIEETENGFRAGKHRIGAIGSSITHLGIVIIILGAFLGNIFAQEGFVNLLPGESLEFKDEGFILKLDDFYLGFREDGSTEQYYSELRLIEEGRDIKSEKIWVNNPLNHKGLNFYQSSFGWVSDLTIKDQDGELVAQDSLRNNQQHFYQPEHLTIFLYGFYPDFAVDKGGQPYSLSQRYKHPHYAAVLYEFGNYIDSYILAPEETIAYKDLEIGFENSRMYTGLIYRKDFGYYFVLLGCLFMFLGLLLSFYFYPKFIIVEDEGIYPVTRQNSWGFNMKIKGILSAKDEGEKGEI